MGAQQTLVKHAIGHGVPLGWLSFLSRETAAPTKVLRSGTARRLLSKTGSGVWWPPPPVALRGSVRKPHEIMVQPLAAEAPKNRQMVRIRPPEMPVATWFLSPNRASGKVSLISTVVEI